MAKRRSSSITGKGSRNSSLNILNAISGVSNTRALRVDGSDGLTKLGIGRKEVTSALQFGNPSRGSSASSTNKNRSGWTGLLGSIGGNGLSDLMGGGVLSSGLDHLVSGFESLFGAGSTSADAVSRFELADTQD